MSLLVTSVDLFGDGSDAIAASLFKQRPLTQTELHRHEFYEIIYVVEGSLENELSTDQMVLKAGDLLILKPYVRHLLRSDPNAPNVLAYCCSFLPRIVDSRVVGLEDLQREGSAHRYFFLPFLPLIQDDVSAVRTHVSAEQQPRIASIMEGILKYATDKSESSRARVKCCFLDLLVTLSDIYSEEQESDTSNFASVTGSLYNEGLRKALNYMHEHLAEPISLDQMAQMSGVSVSYFSVMIKQATGMSFLKYLNGLRMDQACHLLRETNDNITEICYKLGFNDYSHFSRKFKQVTGVSPREFRAEL